MRLAEAAGMLHEHDDDTDLDTARELARLTELEKALRHVSAIFAPPRGAPAHALATVPETVGRQIDRAVSQIVDDARRAIRAGARPPRRRQRRARAG